MIKSVQVHEQLAVVGMAERQKGTETGGICTEHIANGFTSDFPHLAPLMHEIPHKERVSPQSEYQTVLSSAVYSMV